MELILYFIIAVFLSGYLVGRGSSKKKQTNVDARDDKDKLLRYLYSYRMRSSSISSEELINKIIEAVETNEFDITKTVPKEHTNTPSKAAIQDYNAVESVGTEVSVPLEQDVSQLKKNKDIDGTSLLLYFGAFLFIASAGLFVAFADVSGFIKTIIISLVVVLLYGTGQKFVQKSPKLEIVGVAFVGIGMAIAPLVGLAAYNYVFHQAYGSYIWFATSLACLLLYTHAMITLRKPFLNYIFIFTTLSVFESSISIINAPIYVFGWGFSILGIATILISYYKGIWKDFKESAQWTSGFFIPISVMASVLFLPEFGAVQLGVSSFIASIYYLALGVLSKDNERQNYITTMHVMQLFGFANLSYGLFNDWHSVAITLLVLNSLQLVGYALLRNRTYQKNYLGIVTLSTISTALVAIPFPKLLLLAMLLLVALGITIWHGVKGLYGYVIATLALIAVPFVIGLYVLNPAASTLWLTVLVLLSCIIHWAYILWQYGKFQAVNAIDAVSLLFIVNSLAVIGSAFVAGHWAAIYFAVIIALLFWSLGVLCNDKNWISAAGLVLFLPVIRTMGQNIGFFYSVLIAGFGNLLITIAYRQNISRWMWSISWMLLPLATGNAFFSSTWGYSEYAWMYIIVACGFVFARAISRGVIMVSAKIPVSAYDRNNSISYVLGYILASISAFLISLFASNSRLVTTTITLFLIMITYIVARYIERKSSYYALMPLLLQVALLSAIQPSNKLPYASIAYISMSIVIAAFGYILSWMFSNENKSTQTTVLMIKNAFLVTTYIAPASALFLGLNILMPVGLIIAGSLTLHNVWHKTEVAREWAGVIITLGFMWMLWYFGVRELQAYTHVMAALFGLYAYIRFSLNNKAVSNNYLTAMLCMATIPLAAQAISGISGGLYGWWLLIEQILFMILGTIIKNKTVIWWGFYVAVAAVLYQLRDLGWAALTFVALVVTGIAVYRIFKSEPKDPTK